MSRTSKGRKTSGVGGRPVGFLARWLETNHCETKAQHWKPASLLFPVAEREAARAQVESNPGGPELLGFERERGDSEPAAPVSLKGYVAGV